MNYNKCSDLVRLPKLNAKITPNLILQTKYLQKFIQLYYIQNKIVIIQQICKVVQEFRNKIEIPFKDNIIYCELLDSNTTLSIIN